MVQNNYESKKLTCKHCIRPEISPNFFSYLSPNPARKARHDLQLWPIDKKHEDSLSFFADFSAGFSIK